MRPHGELFVGVNLPWTHAYCGYDFGVPPRGWRAAHPSPRDFEGELGAELRALRAEGVRAVRVFLLADAVAYPERRAYDEFAIHGLSPGVKGEKLERARVPPPPPAPLSDEYVADVRALFDACHAAGMRVLPSFLSFEAFFPPKLVSDGTVKQGRGSLILGADREAHPAHVDAFLDATLERLLAIDDGAGRPHPAVLAWELVNEPDWGVRKRHVGGAAMSRFLANGVERIVRAGYVASIGFVRAEVEWLDDAVHERLVELARARRYLHQLHYYPSGFGARLPPARATEFGTATIVGEMAANDTARARWPDPEVAETEADPARFLVGRLAHVVESGYRIAFLWSLRANDDKSGLDADSRRQLAGFDEATAFRDESLS